MGFPSYRRHTKGQARVTLAGRDFLLGPYGSKESKAKYHRLISEYIASGKSKSFKVEPTSLSVSEVLVAYLANAKEIYGVSKRGEYYQIKLAMRPVRQQCICERSSIPSTQIRLLKANHKVVGLDASQA